MSSNNSEQDFDEVNNSDHSTEREGTAGQDGNSSTDVSPGGEHISYIFEDSRSTSTQMRSEHTFKIHTKNYSLFSARGSFVDCIDCIDCGQYHSARKRNYPQFWT